MRIVKSSCGVQQYWYEYKVLVVDCSNIRHYLENLNKENTLPLKYRKLTVGGITRWMGSGKMRDGVTQTKKI